MRRNTFEDNAPIKAHGGVRTGSLVSYWRDIPSERTAERVIGKVLSSTASRVTFVEYRERKDGSVRLGDTRTVSYKNLSIYRCDCERCRPATSGRPSPLVTPESGNQRRLRWPLSS